VHVPSSCDSTCKVSWFVRLVTVAASCDWLLCLTNQVHFKTCETKDDMLTLILLYVPSSPRNRVIVNEKNFKDII
jgi:hypothetical protein